MINYKQLVKTDKGYKNRILDISNYINDLVVDYTIGALIPSLDKYNLIKI